MRAVNPSWGKLTQLPADSKVRYENPYGVFYGTLVHQVPMGAYLTADLIAEDGRRVRDEGRFYPDERN
jgi:hypothetical protein